MPCSVCVTVFFWGGGGKVCAGSCLNLACPSLCSGHHRGGWLPGVKDHPVSRRYERGVEGALPVVDVVLSVNVTSGSDDVMLCWALVSRHLSSTSPPPFFSTCSLLCGQQHPKQRVAIRHCGGGPARLPPDPRVPVHGYQHCMISLQATIACVGSPCFWAGGVVRVAVAP